MENIYSIYLKVLIILNVDCGANVFVFKRVDCIKFSKKNSNGAGIQQH